LIEGKKIKKLENYFKIFPRWLFMPKILLKIAGIKGLYNDFFIIFAL